MLWCREGRLGQDRAVQGSAGADQERSDGMTYVVVMFGDQRGLEGEP
jgi:hypothetical protein